MAKPKKKERKAVTKRPAWVGEIDLSHCEKGLVYNIYQCRKCILEYKQDQARPKRKWALLLPGNKKRQVVEACNCPEPTPLLIKFKKCNCNAEYWGFYLREKETCKLCGAFVLNDMSKEIDYYRLNEMYKQTTEDLSDSHKWDCLNRNFCLDMCKKEGSRRGLACKDCPFYDQATL